MQVFSTAVSTGRRLSIAVLQAIILAAILVALAIALATGGRSAPLGASNALARGNAAITVPDGTFAGSTTATVNPGGGTWVYAACYQSDTLVYAQYVKAGTNNHALLSFGANAQLDQRLRQLCRARRLLEQQRSLARFGINHIRSF